ncbi:MAG: isopentenyl-diphosphate Delta-isomerase [Nanoarchaeota archaeon]|nr:isopentenyl-diphosphate Delta-isomerase [Nanoarchaeota archaeon]
MIDELILVDEKDQEIGYKGKLACHIEKGLLHRAFSIFIFNSKKELLIQQRAKEKMLWPLFWSNSCCSHPRKGEAIENAAARRLVEECGIACELKYIYKFQYSAQFKDEGSENEVCSVFIGKSNTEINPNPDEIKDYKWIKVDNLLKNIKTNPELYTPWFKLEIAELKKRKLL